MQYFPATKIPSVSGCRQLPVGGYNENNFGDIKLELWVKGIPKASRNFIQLCVEGYWDDTIFHRIIKGFITQNGDPTGRISYEITFSSMRFNCYAGKDDNDSQFFFTLSSTPDLQNKHTLFGYNENNFGNIKLELWVKGIPKASRNFIQLCVEGYWDDTIFHRIIKGFITQNGDPTGRISYEITFSSMRFNCYAGKDDNDSQFFFTLSSTPDLQNKHTLFGKFTGETIYIMFKFGEALVDENDRSLYPSRLIKTIILNSPFADISRIIVQEKFSLDSIILYHEKFCYKDFNLVSFGEAAEEDEEESLMLNKKFSNQGKSARDYLTDSKLSS
ncbi:Peptidyl-prolyl isomerase cwc27 [Eufriesea mexicana]|uniref:Spliceosome-associated protein CWC27 homolog n=1 Tax=Eufriesea mexicana TaxID=516756 RepID=A0A310S8Y5_9HYME|nr:Peptidyl-prolyl isomerase cwc27 [Eufriesea mexicana]